MIASLTVENIALIEKLHIEFEDGLNVLTGETGAGKSIIVDAMNLALGERAEKSLIRHGTSSARVEALFYTDSPRTAAVLQAQGITPQEELVIERTLNASGRSRCRINGHTCTLAALKAVMDTVVDLHGQHEHQSLLDPASHVRLLDEMTQGAPAIQEKIRRVAARLSAASRELESLGGDMENRAETMDYLAFQIGELEQASVHPGELAALHQEQVRFGKLTEMGRDLHGARMLLFEGEEPREAAADAMKRAIDHVERCAPYEPKLQPLLETLNDAYYSLTDLSGDLSAILDGLEMDEERRQWVEERLDELQNLLRKYHVRSEEELLERLRTSKERFAQLENAGERHKALETEITGRRGELAQLYRKLSSLRKKAAVSLKKALLHELHALGMPDASFAVAFTGLEEEDAIIYGPHSPEHAEFLLSVNAGEPLRPLSKVASGGEISRIMLAFKVLTADLDGIGTLIFDEVDTGISGHIAQIVAEKMAQIARSHQVITVTHLPQIAAAGDENFYIHKETDGSRTNTYIEPLDEDGKRGEIARLTGGIESESARMHAQELMDNARRLKEKAGRN